MGKIYYDLIYTGKLAKDFPLVLNVVISEPGSQTNQTQK